MADEKTNNRTTFTVQKGDKTIEIDKSRPGVHGKRAEHGLAGDALEGRAPGESGRGDLSDTDRIGSHGQGLHTPDERPAVRGLHDGPKDKKPTREGNDGEF